MFRPFYAFVGYRYTRAKRKNHFISFISLTSVIGVALGVSVLITVLSVMNGFNREIRAQMLTGTPHITVGKLSGALIDWQSLLNTLSKHPHVVGAAPFTLGQGMISNVDARKVQGVLVKGIDPKLVNQVYPLSSRMKEGSLQDLKPSEYKIVLGRTLAQNIGIRLGDKISLIVPEASVTPAGMMPRIKRFTVAGIFEIGDLYDGSQAFIHMQDADKLFRMEGGVTGVQLKLADELEAPIIARDFYQELNDVYWVTDWTQDFGSFFRALQIQKTVMLFILLLIIAVAAFNLVSSLVMMVTDKRSDIAILRALGASRRSIMGIFMAQGSLVGVIGTLLGVLLGLYMAYHVTGWTDTLQRIFNIELVARDVYLVNFLPSEVHGFDVIDKRSRGAFGEVQLKNLVQNILPIDNFAFQHTLSNGNRADCILFLPEPTGHVVIDSKFPLENFQLMTDFSLHDQDRKKAAQAFRQDIKKHINDIASKYIIKGETSEGAILFIPAEAVFAEIHAHFPDLVEIAHRSNVWLSSPTTLMAILTTAQAVLKDSATRQHIHVIQDQLRALAQDFSRFETRMDHLAKHIDQAQQDVQQVHTSAKKITKRFEQIEKCEVGQITVLLEE